jgi:hypothetical protein
LGVGKFLSKKKQKEKNRNVHSLGGVRFGGSGAVMCICVVSVGVRSFVLGSSNSKFGPLYLPVFKHDLS